MTRKEIIQRAHDHSLVKARELAKCKKTNNFIDTKRDHFDRKSFIKGVEWTLETLNIGVQNE